MSQDKFVLVFLEGIYGVTYHRLLTPFMKMMNGGAPIHFFKDFDELKEFDPEEISHIVVSRACTVTNYQSFSAWLKANDIKLVVDLDDYWELNKDNPSYNLYKQYKSVEILESLRMADIMWTPSTYLSKHMHRENPKAEIYIIPNTLDLSHEQWTKRKKPSKEVRFGYVGASSHSKDIDLISYDFTGKKMYSIGISDYTKRFKASHAMSVLPVDRYGELYSNFDVSLAPLQSNMFNRSKSDLKVVEAGYTRSSIIASNTTPYKESIQDGVTGLLCSSPRDWKNAIESMTKEKHRELSGNLNRYVKKHYDLDKLNKIRTESLGL